MRTANLLSCEPGDSWELGAIAGRGMPFGLEIGAERIGAGLYDAEAGKWIGTYHYHHGVEEWLYVVSGAPVLRDPHGERVLNPGDFVCFPPGHAGAHAVAGPGRFLIFSAGEWPDRTGLAVYVDSDKIGARPADHGADNLNFRRGDAVGYWYGEVPDEPVPRPAVVRPPLPDRRQPIVNVDDVELQQFRGGDAPEGFRCRLGRLGPLLGAEWLSASLWEIDPGQGGAPYHCDHACEEWVLVLAGTPDLRHPGGEDRLEPGDVVCFPVGPEGAHRLRNRGSELVRLVIFSTVALPRATEYPDSGKLLVVYSPDQPSAVFRLADAVSYWDGEAE